MAMKVRYNVVSGELVSENRAGTKSFYGTDALGSTITLRDAGGVVTDNYNYWPFGQTHTHTGSSLTPFEFAGGLGYRRVSSSLSYIRARYYLQNLTRWLTWDPMNALSNEGLYVYANNRPTLLIDPSGLAPVGPPSPTGFTYDSCPVGEIMVDHDDSNIGTLTPFTEGDCAFTYPSYDLNAGNKSINVGISGPLCKCKETVYTGKWTISTKRCDIVGTRSQYIYDPHTGAQVGSYIAYVAKWIPFSTHTCTGELRKVRVSCIWDQDWRIVSEYSTRLTCVPPLPPGAKTGSGPNRKVVGYPS